MFMKISEVSPVPSNVPEHMAGVLEQTFGGSMQLLGSTKVGAWGWGFIAVRHAPLDGKTNHSGLYPYQFSVGGKGKEKKASFIIFPEAQAPAQAACCPQKLLTATEAYGSNAEFRAACATFNDSKKSMANLIIGASIVFFKKGVVTVNGQKVIAVHYDNVDSWHPLIDEGNGSNRRLNAAPANLYRYGAEVIYPDLLDPILPHEVSPAYKQGIGIYYEEVGGDYIIRGRVATEVEVREHRLNGVAHLIDKQPKGSGARSGGRLLFL